MSWRNPLDVLPKEDKDIFYEFGGSDNDLVWWAPIKLFINLVKKLREKGVI